MELKDKLKDVPTNAGVYLMYDEKGEIIYVGKAKNLRNRLRQYFAGGIQNVKVAAMMNKVRDFKYIIAQNEVDALVTENNLIKQHSPKYNIMLKDDKSYPFIRVDLRERYPRFTLVRKLKRDGAKYFGPYMHQINIRDVFDILHTAFKLRSCSIDFSKSRRPSRPCLNYHLDRCLAPCHYDGLEEQYRAQVLKAIEFLRGDDKEVERLLKEKMQKFAKEENFEAAIACRDKLKVLDNLVRQQVSNVATLSDADVFAKRSDGINTVIAAAFIRGGKSVGFDSFTVEGEDDDLDSFLMQYYGFNPPSCEEIILEECESPEALSTVIAKPDGGKLKITVPSKGIKKQLVELCSTNALDRLKKLGDEKERRERMTVGALEQLKRYLNLKNTPYRIEAYDISHISGTDVVSSMVVFEGGTPKKSHYRKFKIKTVEGNDDFASMRETLSRRLKRVGGGDESFDAVPDLILIDGGKGQLHYAKEALKEFGFEGIEIISLAKKEEEVFFDKEPIILPRDSLALGLLQRVRDEAHRFAVTFHKKRRASHIYESELKKIDGVGEKRIAELFKHFKTFDKIKNASVEELQSVKGISKPLADKIYRYFNDDNPASPDVADT